MKLLNKSLLWLSASLFFVIGLGMAILYFNMHGEIKGSVDEGLENYKRQIIYQAQKDSTLLTKSSFEVSFFEIREIKQKEALKFTDQYIDTLMYMQDADDESAELEPVRILTTVFENNQRYYKLRIANSMVEEDDLVKQLFKSALIIYLFLIASIYIINHFVLKRLWKPFYIFLHQLKDYQVTKHDNFPSTNTNIKEFKDLQNAVTILLQRHLEAYQQQKQFIENASHELQTPLAIAKNKLELLIENGSLQNQQTESVGEILDILERLVRLNKLLLLLTKIDNKQFLNDTSVSINQIVRQNISDLEEIAEFKNVSISLEEQAELNVQMDFSLGNIVVSNLIRNAIFHNIDGGIINISIVPDRLIISNTGIDTALNEEKVFTRFYKSSNNNGGTGLGLAIVKSVCNLYGFSINYGFKAQLHAFEINFKQQQDT